MLQVDINDIEINRQAYLNLIDFKINRDLFGDTDRLHISLDNSRLIKDGEFSWSGWVYRIKLVFAQWVSPEEVETCKRKLSEEYIDLMIALFKEQLDLICVKYPEERSSIEEELVHLLTQKSILGGKM